MTGRALLIVLCHAVLCHAVLSRGDVSRSIVSRGVVSCSVVSLIVVTRCCVTQEDADREWKYARSVVWMQYLESTRMLPSPLNILPNVRNFLDFAAWILAVCRFPKGSRAKCSVEVRERRVENRRKERELLWASRDMKEERGVIHG